MHVFLGPQRDGIKGADDCKQLAQQSTKVHAGLRTLHILSTTGVGRTQDMSAAFEVMRIAIQDRTFVLTSHQQGELEAWVSRCGLLQRQLCAACLKSSLPVAIPNMHHSSMIGLQAYSFEQS